MGGLSPWHIVLIALVVLLVFGGRGKLSGLMGDAAKGVRAFRDGLKGDEDKPAEAAAQPLPSPATATVAPDKDPIVR
jgi:sec-independent protein translocase protein TatA